MSPRANQSQTAKSREVHVVSNTHIIDPSWGEFICRRVMIPLANTDTKMSLSGGQIYTFSLSNSKVTGSLIRIVVTRMKNKLDCSR